MLAGIHQAAAQGTTAFTYQGQLHDGGTNANGAYTMMFKLYDAVTSGNQIGSTITTNPTLANGLFSVNLDFGGSVQRRARWLDITVTNGGTTQDAFTTRAGAARTVCPVCGRRSRRYEWRNYERANRQVTL